MTGTIIRPATESDEAALTALWATAFTPPLTPDQWLLDEQRLAHTLVAADAEGVCGSIHGLPKQLRETDGTTALVHCIGSVAVAEHARGRGLARMLVTGTLATAAHADWALLFTGTPDVYRSSGFEVFELRRTLSGPWQPPAGGTPAGGTPTTDRIEYRHPTSAPMRELYERSRAGLTLAPVRGDRDWAMAEVRLSGAVLHTWQAGGAPAGYALTQVHPESDEVHGVLAEVAVDPAHADEAWPQLLAAVAADWADAGVTHCDLAVPDVDDPVQRDALTAFAPLAARHPDRTGMTRPLRRKPRLDGIRHLTAADYF